MEIIHKSSNLSTLEELCESQRITIDLKTTIIELQDRVISKQEEHISELENELEILRKNTSIVYK